LDSGDDLSIWLSRDPDHLTNTAYMEIGMALLNGDIDDEVFQPPKKRQRLGRVSCSAGQAGQHGLGAPTDCGLAHPLC